VHRYAQCIAPLRDRVVIELVEMWLVANYKIKAAGPAKEVVGSGADLAGGYVRPWYRRVVLQFHFILQPHCQN